MSTVVGTNCLRCGGVAAGRSKGWAYRSNNGRHARRRREHMLLHGGRQHEPACARRQQQHQRDGPHANRGTRSVVNLNLGGSAHAWRVPHECLVTWRGRVRDGEKCAARPRASLRAAWCSYWTERSCRTTTRGPSRSARAPLQPHSAPAPQALLDQHQAAAGLAAGLVAGRAVDLVAQAAHRSTRWQLSSASRARCSPSHGCTRASRSARSRWSSQASLASPRSFSDGACSLSPRRCTS